MALQQQLAVAAAIAQQHQQQLTSDATLAAVLEQQRQQLLAAFGAAAAQQQEDAAAGGSGGVEPDSRPGECGPFAEESGTQNFDVCGPVVFPRLSQSPPVYEPDGLEGLGGPRDGLTVTEDEGSIVFSWAYGREGELPVFMQEGVAAAAVGGGAV